MLGCLQLFTMTISCWMMEKSSSVEADGEMLITVLVEADQPVSLLNPMKASPGSILMTLMAVSSPFSLFRA